MPELWLALGAGVLSSMHCVGMCGPIVIGCSHNITQPIQIDISGNSAVLRATTSSVVIPQVLYNGGRVISYATIGMFAGLLGGVTMISPLMQQVFTITFGVLMIVAALFQLDIFKRRSSSVSKSKIFKTLGSLIQSRSSESRFLIGLLTPLLPCGLLYGMALHSAATHSPVLGALEMGVFALGAAPALILLATLSHSIGARFRKYGSTLAVVLLITMGLLTILRGAGLYSNPFESDTEKSCCTPQAQVLRK